MISHLRNFIKMAKNQRNGDGVGVSKLLSFVAWLTGILVSLSVGFGMIEGTLSLPYWLGGDAVAMIVGWVVVVTTLLGALLAILKK